MIVSSKHSKTAKILLDLASETEIVDKFARFEWHKKLMQTKLESPKEMG